MIARLAPGGSEQARPVAYRVTPLCCRAVPLRFAVDVPCDDLRLPRRPRITGALLQDPHSPKLADKLCRVVAGKNLDETVGDGLGLGDVRW